MPLQARTRKQLRVSIGYDLAALYASSLSSIGGAAGASIVDNTLRGGDDDHKGDWVLLTSGDRNGDLSRVSAYTASSYTAAVLPAFAAQIASAVTYELWDEPFSPTRIHDLINQALIESTGLFYDPLQSVALHGDGRQARFDIPSAFVMLNRVEYRAKVEAKVIHLATSAWTAGSNTTASQDTKDYKRGPGSAKLVVAAAAAVGTVIGTKAITSLNVSGYTHAEFWIKSTVATAAGDLQLLLDDTASAVSPIETLSVPALVANVWTFVRVALATPALDTAIISVGLKYTVDIGAVTIWLNDIQATHSDNEVWERVHPFHWSVDKQARDLILDRTARAEIGNRLIKLTGGQIPALLTADTGATVVDDQFIIARVVGLTLAASAKGPSTDPDGMGSRARTWLAMAEDRKKLWSLPADTHLL